MWSYNVTLERKCIYIFTFDFYKFIFTVNKYLLDLYDLAFFLYFVLNLWREFKANEIFCAILGKKQLIMVEFAKCGISRGRCRIE